MEAYESKCQNCGHKWYWTGLKTGIGYPEDYKAQFERNSKCPACGGTAKTGLDHTSENGKLMDESASMVIQSVLGHFGKPSGHLRLRSVPGENQVPELGELVGGVVRIGVSGDREDPGGDGSGVCPGPGIGPASCDVHERFPERRAGQKHQREPETVVEERLVRDE